MAELFTIPVTAAMGVAGAMVAVAMADAEGFSIACTIDVPSGMPTAAVVAAAMEGT